MSTLDMPDFFDKTYFSEDCTCDTHGQKAPPSGSEKKHQTDLLFPTSYLWRVDGRASVFSSQPHPSLSLFTFTFHFFFVIIHLYLLITNHLKRGGDCIESSWNTCFKICQCEGVLSNATEKIPVENCGSHYLCLSWSICNLKPQN